jgi:hypothetical protein
MSEVIPLPNLRRLRELALEIGFSDGLGESSYGAKSAADVKSAAIQLGERMLLKLTERQAALLSSRGESWERLVPALIGLEQLSWLELTHLEALAEQARAGARATIDALPMRWQVQCRITIATAVPSLIDLTECASTHLTSRLRRRLAADSRSLCRSAARELHRALLRQLVGAVESLYPLACSADEILRAAQFTVSSNTQAQAPASLVARLAARRGQWQHAGELLENADESTAADFDIGALANALGVTVITSALAAVRASGPLAGSSLEELRSAVRDAAHDAVRHEWQSKISGVHVAVDEHVSEGFADLQREIDDWFSEVQHWAARLCGGAAAVKDQDHGARVEILDILRQTERLPG